MVNRFVQKMSGMAELTVLDIAALEAATANPRRYAARKDLIREGDEPGPMFIVLEGWICRSSPLRRDWLSRSRPRSLLRRCRECCAGR